jgi:hypothetical protein
MPRKTEQKEYFLQLEKKAGDVSAKALEPDPWEKKQKRIK